MTAILVGGLVGWLAGMFREMTRMGILASVIVGIAGSLLASLGGHAVGVPSTSAAMACLVAVLGAAPLIGLLHFLGIFKTGAAWRYCR